MPRKDIPQGVWTVLATGITSAVVEVADDGVLLFIGAAIPTNNDVAFSLPSAFPFVPPNIAGYGGGLWVLSTVKATVVKYVSA